MASSGTSFAGYCCGALALVLAAGSSPASAQLADFVGTWYAQNQNAGEASTIIVTRSRIGVDVRVFGLCEQRECDWGTVRGDIYAGSPGSRQMQDAQTITARFNLRFGEKLVVMREARGNNVTVDVFTTYPERTRRANFISTQRMRIDRRRPFAGQRPIGPSAQRNAQWEQQYGRTYSYNDDLYYQQCRNTVDPAGVIAGALIGGLLGNVIGDGSGGATVAGVIVGGVAGAALTRDLTCEDQSYAYRAYYDGLNAGYPDRTYRWQNPQSGRYGTFHVGDYYDDPYGFHCANYSQAIYVNGRMQEAQGRACQQADGTWTIVQ